MAEDKILEFRNTYPIWAVSVIVKICAVTGKKISMLILLRLILYLVYKRLVSSAQNCLFVLLAGWLKIIFSHIKTVREDKILILENFTGLPGKHVY